MATGRFSFIVDVISKGVGKAKQGIADLGNSLTQQSRAYGGANSAARDLYSTQEKGIIGTANSTRSFSKLAQTMNSGGGVVGAYATLAANMFAVSAAFNALRSAAQAQQVMEGLAAAGNRVGITMQVTAGRVKELSDGMLTAEQAARSTAQFMASGFKTESLERMTVLAKDVSVALGRNMTDSMDRLTRGVVKLEPELLDELGIMTKIGESSSAYAASLGKTAGALTNYEKRQGFMNAVLAEGELKFGGISKAAGDTLAYEKLAATFSDLTKDILGFISKAGAGIATFFANSKASIAGVGVLFASTISKQLLPGIANVSERSSKLAELAQAKNAQRLKGISESFSDTKLQIGTTWMESVKEGTSNTREFTEAATELKGVIKEYDDLSLKPFNEFVGPKTLQDTDRYNKDLAEQLKLKAALKTASRIETDRMRGNAQSTAAIAMQEASEGSILSGFGALKDSFAEFGTVADDGEKKGGKFAKGMFMVSKSVQFAGATFLRVLPWIGMFTAAYGIAMSIWNSWSGKNSKANVELAGAVEDLNKVTDAASEKLANLVRIEQSVASMSLRAEQTITLRSQAITELADTYLKASEKARALAKEEANIEAARKARSAAALANKKNLAGPSEEDQLAAARGGAMVTSISSDGPGIAAAEQKVLNRAEKLGINSKGIIAKAFSNLPDNEAGDAMLKSLEALNKFAPDKVLAAIGRLGGATKLSKLEVNRLQQAADEMNKSITGDFTGAADAAKNLVESLKAADGAFGSFFRSAAQSTPYDDIVDKMQGVTTAILEAKEAGARTGQGVDFKAILAGMGGEMMRFIDPAVKQNLENLRIADQTVQTIRAQYMATGQVSDEQKVAWKTARETQKTQNDVLVALEAQSFKVQEIFQAAQNADRLNKGRLQIMQAQVQASANINSITAEGTRARIEGEEKMTRLQMAGLKTRISTLKTAAANLNLSKEEHKSLQGRSAEEMIIWRTKQLQVIEQGRLAAANLRQNLENDTTGEFRKRLKELYPDRTIDDRFINESLQKMTQNALGIEAALEAAKSARDKLFQRRDVDSSINALNMEVKALEETLLSTGQKQAEIDAKQAEIFQGRIQSLQQVRDIANNILNIHAKTAILLSGNQSTLRDEIQELTRERNNSSKALVDERKAIASNLDSARKRANADIAAGKATAAVAASVVKHYEKEAEIQDKILEVRQQELDAQYTLNVLERVHFDIRKEGIEWQREGLNYIERELEARNELLAIDREIADVNREIDIKRRGAKDIPGFDRSAQIDAALEGFRIAVEEAKLRKSVIRLEFALLKAQHTQLLVDLETRRAEMLALNIDGVPVYKEHSTAIRQLTAATNSLKAAVPNDRMLNMQLAAVDRAGDLALAKLNSATTREGFGTNELGNFLAGRRAEDESRARAAREEARLTSQRLAEARKDRNPVSATGDADLDGASKEAKVALEARRQQQNELVAALKSLTTAIQTQLSKLLGSAQVSEQSATMTAGTDVPVLTGTLYEKLSTFKNFIEKKFPNVEGELDRHGGRSKDRRAIDFNVKGMGTEWGNAAGQAILTEIASLARQAGLGTLWGPEGSEFNKRRIPKHLNHLHVDSVADAPSSARTANREATTPTIAPRAVADETPTLNQAIKNEKRVQIAAGNLLEQTRESSDEVFDILAEVTKEVVPSKIVPYMEHLREQAIDFIGTYEALTSKLMQGFDELGPAGKVAANVFNSMNNIAKNVVDNFEIATGKVWEYKQVVDAATGEGLYDASGAAVMAWSQKHVTANERVIAAANMASSVVSGVQSILAASTEAKIANIDKEIAAEQKRDGKSVESMARIESLERRKDSAQRKAFNVNKKLQMANAIISTASGIASALTLGPIAGPIMAAVIGAMGAAQLAIIAGTSYQSTSTQGANAKTPPTTLTIGKRGDSVDLAKNNANAGGEIGYLRGRNGTGRNAANYNVIGSAYGGPMPRGYGNTAFTVGEKGPETIFPDTPITVRPNGEGGSNSQNITANFNVSAIDGASVEQLFRDQRGNMIGMIREAANANGQTFLEDVNVNVYTNPRVSKL